MRCASGPAPIEQSQTVQQQLTTTFRRYGLPEAFFVDNGSPWGDPSGAIGPARRSGCSSSASMSGIPALSSAEPRQERALPSHPEGRSVPHATLSRSAELQRAFDRWRNVYNLRATASGARSDVPASRYRPSSRAMPDRLPEVEYDSTEMCAASPPPRPMSASRAECGRCRKPSAANAWPSGR